MTGKTILCVDDEAMCLSARKMLLESQGYRVLTAENGSEALLLFSSESETIDLVVVDYAMPGMNGGQVAHGMKTIRPRIPIIMASAYLDLPQATLQLVDKFISKGESPLVLLEAIEILLNREDIRSVFHKRERALHKRERNLSTYDRRKERRSSRGR